MKWKFWKKEKVKKKKGLIFNKYEISDYMPHPGGIVITFSKYKDFYNYLTEHVDGGDLFMKNKQIYLIYGDNTFIYDGKEDYKNL